MKPTQLAELFANVRKTFVSFFSILMFVALGAGVFVGINWTSPALESAADVVFDEGAFHNVQVTFPYGLTDDDLDELAGIEGVSAVEGARQSFQGFVRDGKELSVKVQSCGRDVDTLIVREGTLPASADEIAVKASSAGVLGVGVGDSVEFVHDAGKGDSPDGADASGGDGMKYLNGSKFTVTALVDSPEYIAKSSSSYGYSTSGSGSVDALAWVGADAFDASAFQDGWPVVNVRCDSLPAGSFTGEYAQASAAVEARVEELGDRLADERYQDLHGQAQAKVDESEAKLEEAHEQISSGERQLSDAREELDDAVAEGQAKLADAYLKLLDGEDLKKLAERQLAEAEELLDWAREALEEVDDAEEKASAAISEAAGRKADLDKRLEKGGITQEEYDRTLDDYGVELSAQLKPFAENAGVDIPATTHENYSQALATAKSALDEIEDVQVTVNGETMTVGEARGKVKELEERIESGRAELEEKAAQLAEGWSEYYSGQAELDQKEAEGERRIADGQAQLDDAREQAKAGEAQLEKAKEQVASMKDYDWTVAGRSYNGGAVEVSMFSGVTMRLSLSMAALFFIVGLLVSYSAVSRIVHEQITQIGTKKALGLREHEITASFLAYSALAVLAGCVVGIAVGVVLVEGIIGHVLGSRFIMGDYPPYFGLPMALGVTALELVLVLGATWLACHKVLAEQAVELLKGEAPPEAKTRFFEKWGVWDRLPLFTQTIVNNCLNDKRRVFSTIVGVAGCTALIVTAITLNDDVMTSYDAHYEDVYGFNAIVHVDSSTGTAEDVVVSLEERGMEGAAVRRQSFSATKPDGSLTAMRLVVPADEGAFSRVYHVNPVGGSGEADLDAGVWVSQAYADHLGAKAGDDLVLDAGDGVARRVSIAGFYEFHLTSNEAVMGRSLYESVFEGDLAANAVLADTGDRSVTDASAGLVGTPGFDSMSDDKASQGSNFRDFSSISRTVVLIYLALAALMAVVVLLNLNVMFIDEKKRDLIVLMINGFSSRDAKRYIYNDTIVLTALGIVVGVVLGAVMGSVTVAAVEPETASFLKGVAWRAVVVGAAGSAVLAAVMSMVALRRIPRFALTDINKL